MHVLREGQRRHGDAPKAVTGPRPRSDAYPRDASGLRTSRRKAVLFCSECDHESHIDGDWIRRESAGRTDHECPECGSVVVSQPTFPGSPGG